MRLRSLVLSILCCTSVGGAYLLVSDEPAPTEAAGHLLGNFGISPPADPPANFSLDMRTHMEGGALHVEKLEFFYAPGVVPNPTITKGKDGSANVHIWVTRPRVKLISTKCEFVRTVRFSIPKSVLVGASKLVLVNHDTGARQVLAESEVLRRLLREAETGSGQARRQSNFPATSSGCGA